MGSSTISLGLGLGGGKAATSSGSPTGGGAFPNQYSLDFDGTDDELTIPQGTFNLGSGLFSFSLWFNADSLNSYNCLFRINSSTSLSCSSFIRSNGEIWLSNWSFNQLVSTGNTINTGAWNHLAYVKSTTGSSGTVTIYFNGSSVASGPIPSGSSFGSETGTSAIGRSYAATHYPFNGKIDEFAFWNSALSASDVAALRDTTGSNPVPADIKTLNPVGWWRMGDGSDGSGNNDGTVVGGLPQIYNVATDGSGNRITGIDGSMTNIAPPNGIVTDVPS